MTSPPKRNRLIKKTNGKCFYCGKPLRLGKSKKGKVRMQADHFIPLSTGGSIGINNAVPSCNACNKLKGNMVPLYVKCPVL